MWLTWLVILVSATTPTSQYYYDYRNEDYYDEPPASDCIHEFSSQTSKEGIFTSPHYPNAYPPNQRCKYIFQAQGMERVQIEFTDIDLNSGLSSTTIPNYCDDEAEDMIWVTIPSEGRNTDIASLCNVSSLGSYMSDGQHMEVIFKTKQWDQSGARGFSAKYRFVTDFQIPLLFGEQVGSQCEFVFLSSNSTFGVFYSPNYPGLYPRNTECVYKFYGDVNETVTIRFHTFDVEGIPPRCDSLTKSDYVAFSNFNNIPDRKFRRLCGITLKAVNRMGVQSDGRFFSVTFHSNDIYDAHGFLGAYQFKKNE